MIGARRGRLRLAHFKSTNARSALSSLLPGSNERKEQAFRDAASAGNVAVVTEMMSPDLVNTVDLRNDKSPNPPNPPMTQ